MGRRIQRPRPHRDAARTVLAVTNGGVTEKRYLNLLQRVLRTDPSLSLQVKVFKGLEPESLLRKLARTEIDLSIYDEVWLVVDEDGQPRDDFIRGTGQLSMELDRPIHAIVSVPCFEVWLIAHYQPVRLYSTQADAQDHYREVTGLSSKSAKDIPDSFPIMSTTKAAKNCRLPGTPIPMPDTIGECPSTPMPYFLHSVGLLDPSAIGTE